MTDSGPNKTISASDVEKYGYCPLSWWLSEKMNDKEDRTLVKGSKQHAEISRDVTKIRTKEKFSKEYERGIIWFSLIALVIGINGMGIIYSIYAPSSQHQAVMIMLSVISVIWVIIAVIFFYFGIKMERATKAREESAFLESREIKPLKDPKKRVKETRWNMFLFFVVSGVLAMHGFLILLNAEQEQSQLRTWIFLILSLVWLIGSSIFYYISLKKEMKSEEDTIGDSEESGKKPFSETEISVILFSVVATILASNALITFYGASSNIASILFIIAILWLYGGFIFLYRAIRANLRIKLFIGVKLSRLKGVLPKSVRARISGQELKESLLSYERGVLLFALVAMILAINAIIMNFSRNLEDLFGTLIAHIFEFVALLWLIGAVFFLYLVSLSTKTAAKLRSDYGIDTGSIEYVDDLTGSTESLTSERYNLSGRPDYILKREGKLIPVEVKTGRVPRGPLFSHILQLAAYCFLIEERYNSPPPFGIIKYSDKEHEIDYDEGLKNILISKIAEMREIIQKGEAHRNHNRESKCRFCSRRDICPEKLI